MMAREKSFGNSATLRLFDERGFARIAQARAMLRARISPRVATARHQGMERAGRAAQRRGMAVRRI
jgi:hypothetical protein